MSDFARRLIRWHKPFGRHDLPWQNTRDPYRVWLSEVMLQQTQVATVIPYYQRFAKRFPDFSALAAAPVEDVMALWSGLGYYARARNLHACAKTVIDKFGGEFPRDPTIIASLPGIGISTANAIAVFCFDAKAAILDGNVKRVLTRVFGIAGFTGSSAVEKTLWRLAVDLLPAKSVDVYIQAQMDLGATICTRGKPRCENCPLQEVCIAKLASRIDEFPSTRPARKLPEKQAVMLVLVHQGKVLLEKRPPSGIWGGLLSLPELPADRDAGSYAQIHLGCKVGKWRSLPGVRHSFTHFHLNVTPQVAHAEPVPRAAEDHLRWVAMTDIKDAALPAPVRRILLAV